MCLRYCNVVVGRNISRRTVGRLDPHWLHAQHWCDAGSILSPPTCPGTISFQFFVGFTYLHAVCQHGEPYQLQPLNRNQPCCTPCPERYKHVIPCLDVCQYHYSRYIWIVSTISIIAILTWHSHTTIFVLSQSVSYSRSQ